MNTDDYGRYPIAKARNPYTCGLTGRTFTGAEVARRVDLLSRAIHKRLNFDPNDSTEWDRIVAIFSVNTIDYIPFTHAIHRLNGIVTPASAAYSAAELEHQLRTSGARAIFTCVPLLDTALEAAGKVGIPREAIFLMPLPNGPSTKPGFVGLDELVKEGEGLPEVKRAKWIKGQAVRQVAFMCFSSGTSGLPKAVMISHQNMIANILQMTIFDGPARRELGVDTQVSLGLLPLSHIYGLTLNAHVSQFRGDEVIILPRFELSTFLAAVARFRIEFLSVVPPILIQLLNNPEQADATDLTSVRLVMCGAAPLGSEVQEGLMKKYPKWHVIQAYGMTEASPLVVTTSELDILIGSSGSLVPGFKAKIVDLEGNEITAYETPGEMLVQSPSVVLGYLNNEKANAETFIHHEDGRWLRTGDEVLVRKSPQGNEHFVVVDRIKELIKVKGHQVAPAELEAHLLAHAGVDDCAVIPVPDDRSGEVPKAFVVKTKAASGGDDAALTKDILRHVEEHKARHKWLKGGIEFIDVIPKSASGKILRRLLRDKEKDKRRAKSAKL